MDGILENNSTIVSAYDLKVFVGPTHSSFYQESCRYCLWAPHIQVIQWGPSQYVLIQVSHSGFFAGLNKNEVANYSMLDSQKANSLKDLNLRSLLHLFNITNIVHSIGNYTTRGVEIVWTVEIVLRGKKPSLTFSQFRVQVLEVVEDRKIANRI
ncbi:hypothetical protein O6H91_04G042900 [Diphasiastrum complanatum]|uniref:Uncharacterized protein n=1 Tax=Diphasiastrum complanatum TaxID=34168 RepID=A0ACC2DWN3_DIPCM|nr:hypothetical protein O6H91_04G042900 [Diphasiastrum complanatum]